MSTSTPGDRIVITVDGVDLDNSILSCAVADQMTSQSVIAHVEDNFVIRTLDGLVLRGIYPDSTTFFLEVTQLSADPV